MISIDSLVFEDMVVWRKKLSTKEKYLLEKKDRKVIYTFYGNIVKDVKIKDDLIKGRDINSYLEKTGDVNLQTLKLIKHAN